VFRKERIARARYKARDREGAGGVQDDQDVEPALRHSRGNHQISSSAPVNATQEGTWRFPEINLLAFV